METKDIILIILVILVIYLIYKTRNLEKFSSDTNIVSAINNKYKIDMDALRNLAAISKKILDGGDVLKIPANLTDILGSAYIKGTLGVANEAIFYNDVKFPYRNNSIMDTLPSWMIMMWMQAKPPRGWAICDGRRYKLVNGTAVATEEPDNTNTDPSGNYIGTYVLQTPDLRGRCVIGAGQSSIVGQNGVKLTNRGLWDLGGQEDVTLTVAQMPAHSHNNNMTANTNGDCTNGYTFDCGGGGDTYTDNGIPLIGNTGGGMPHTNMQPWYVLNYIMKL
jgi:microcystin-dependent protein